MEYLGQVMNIMTLRVRIQLLRHAGTIAISLNDRRTTNQLSQCIEKTSYNSRHIN